MSFTREQVLAALSKFLSRAITIPAIGGTVYVRPLTVAGMARMHAAQRPGPDGKPVMDHERSSAIMLMDCIVDEEGKRIFADDQEQTVRDMPGTVANVMLDAINEVSLMNAGGSDTASGN